MDWQITQGMVLVHNGYVGIVVEKIMSTTSYRGTKSKDF